MNNENSTFLIIAWANAIFGTLFSQPVLSKASYIVSIAGGIVYIYTTFKKDKK